MPESGSAQRLMRARRCRPLAIIRPPAFRVFLSKNVKDIFLAAVLDLLGTAPVQAAPAAAAGPRFSELAKADRARLDSQRAVVRRTLKTRYDVARLSGSRADIPLLQRMVDDRIFSKSQTYELHSLGVAFGDVLAKELGLRWVIVTDEYGTDPTLRYRDTTIQVNALTMVAKRVEEGRAVDLQAIYEGVRSHIAETLKSGDYR
jgi:hypothetical protein